MGLFDKMRNNKKESNTGSQDVDENFTGFKVMNGEELLDMLSKEYKYIDKNSNDGDFGFAKEFREIYHFDFKFHLSDGDSDKLDSSFDKLADILGYWGMIFPDDANYKCADLILRSYSTSAYSYGEFKQKAMEITKFRPINESLFEYYAAQLDMISMRLQG